MDAHVYDVIVVGAGVVGSSTAYALAQRGRRVLLLEKFPLPHTRGSSHGQSRIIRLMYDNILYARMTQAAISKWRNIESAVGETLLIQNGMLQIERVQSPVISKLLANFKELGEEVHLLERKDVQKKLPLFDLPEGYVGLYEPGGGMLMANKCVLSIQKLFREVGGRLIDGEPVERIVPGQTVRVTTSKSTYLAKSVVIAAGPWTGQICRDLGLNLPLKPTGVHACYWKLKEKSALGSAANFPSFVQREPFHVYGLAVHEYPGLVKICNHSGNLIDPDVRRDSPDINNLSSFITSFLPGIESDPVIVEDCIYTSTPDHDFILDRHPAHRNIVIGAGFSGTGFKMAPITGEILADLVTGDALQFNIAQFSVNRFDDVIRPKSSL